MSRIVLTMALGSEKYVEQALGLARSLALVGDRTPRVVITDQPDQRLRRWFDEVVTPGASLSPYLLKFAGLRSTNADEVLFVDSDSLVFRRLDPIWNAFKGCSIGVQGEWITDGHWYGWLNEVLPRLGVERLPMFNGGMIYYRRCLETETAFEKVAEFAADYRRSPFELFRGVVPDEPCLGAVLAQTGIGSVLPDTSDFMNTPVGLVGRLDVDVMRSQCKFVKHGRHGLRVITPIILHAGKYVNNTFYWKELAKLESLQKYAERHEYGYMSPFQKLERSVERRLLRLFGYL